MPAGVRPTPGGRGPRPGGTAARSPLRAFLAFWLLGALVGAPAAWAARSAVGPPATPLPARPATVRRPVSIPPGLAAELDSRIARGFELLRAQRLLESFQEFRKAAELAPWDARAHHGMGEFYRRIDRAERAEPSYREALRCDPGLARTKLSLARVLRELGRLEEALAVLRALAQDGGCDPSVWLEIGKNELRLDRPREAIPWLEKYVEKVPGGALGVATLGLARAGSGEAEAAERLYRRALASDDKEPLVWLWLGRLLVEAGRKGEGESCLGTFRELRTVLDQLRAAERDLLRRPDDVVALVRVAKAKYQLGRNRDALQILDRAIEIRPDDDALRRLRDGVAADARESVPREDDVVPDR